MTNILDLVLNNKGDRVRHHKGDRGGKRGSFGEVVQIAETEAQFDLALAHNLGGFLGLGIGIAGLAELDVTVSKITGDIEFDSHFGGSNVDWRNKI